MHRYGARNQLKNFMKLIIIKFSMKGTLKILYNYLIYVKKKKRNKKVGSTLCTCMSCWVPRTSYIHCIVCKEFIIATYIISIFCVCQIWKWRNPDFTKWFLCFKIIEKQKIKQNVSLFSVLWNDFLSKNRGQNKRYFFLISQNNCFTNRIELILLWNEHF